MEKSKVRAIDSDGSSLPSWAHPHTSDDDSDSEPSPSKKEQIAKEAAELVAQQKRLSVRDLASKFEKGQAVAQAAAAKAIEDASRTKDALLLDNKALLKKLRVLLGELLGRVAGRNKDDVEEALTSTEVLTVQFTQRETELSQEKAEVRKMAALFKQASDDARKMVEESRAVAQAEIEVAKAAVQRVQAAFEAQTQEWNMADKKELDDLKKAAQEAQRIKMLHDSSKVMDMEHQLAGLREQLEEKAAEVVKLRKELESFKRPDGGKIPWHQLSGTEQLGGILSVTAVENSMSDMSTCSIQWHRFSGDGCKSEPISGAIRPQYAPEPYDVGRILRADVTLPGGKTETVSTSGLIDPAPGLTAYVEVLVKKGAAEFNAKIIFQNGEAVEKIIAHVLDIGKTRIKLRKGRSVKVKEPYSSAMQLCGARGGGDEATRSLYWYAKKGLSYVLVLESARERNAAVMLARRFAFDAGIMLGGPDDRVPL